MNPGIFPIGSPASRAAAREELQRRISHDFSDATVVIWTGLPTPKVTDEPLVAVPPDFIAYRVAQDDSIIRATH
jgi:hypothetical protein